MKTLTLILLYLADIIFKKWFSEKVPSFGKLSGKALKIFKSLRAQAIQFRVAHSYPFAYADYMFFKVYKLALITVLFLMMVLETIRCLAVIDNPLSQELFFYKGALILGLVAVVIFLPSASKPIRTA